MQRSFDEWRARSEESREREKATYGALGTVEAAVLGQSRPAEEDGCIA